MDRRTALRALPLSLLTLVLRRRPVRATGPLPHPEPRPGITAARVLADDRLHGDVELTRVFGQVRRIPQVMDGVQCYCGCVEIPGHYSLLSCFEADGMARHCEVCTGEARLVFELHAQGRTLAQIRTAIDEKYAL